MRGLHDYEKHKDIFHFLRTKKFNIYLLQETHLTTSLESYIRAEWGGDAYFSSYRSNAKGVCILFNSNFEYKILNKRTDREGQFICLDLEIEGKKITLVNIYGPNEDRPEFYTNIADIIEEVGNDTCIIGGDFNIAQNQYLDTCNYCHINNPRAKECLLNIKVDLNLVDPFREMNEFEKRFTWRKSNPVKQARLDFFLISESLMHNISNVDIIPSYRSDHSTVLLSFQINEFKRGSGIWKFNNSLLKDNDYIKVVKKCIFDVREQYAVPVYNTQYIEDESDLQFTISDQLFLDVLLMEIRGKTISYSSYKKKQNILQEEKLQVEIKALEQDFNIDMLDILERKKIELQNLRKEKLEGVIIRSRTRWAEEGEKPTKYFCSLESRNFINKTIPKMELENGEIIYKQADILEEVKEYYHNLYNFQERDRNIDYDDIFNKLGDCPKLTEHEKNKLEGEIKEQEIGQILKKNEK